MGQLVLLLLMDSVSQLISLLPVSHRELFIATSPSHHPHVFILSFSFHVFLGLFLPPSPLYRRSLIPLSPPPPPAGVCLIREGGFVRVPH